MLFIYVDDMFLTGEDELIKDARRRLDIEFDMKYLGNTSRKFNVCI